MYHKHECKVNIPWNSGIKVYLMKKIYIQATQGYLKKKTKKKNLRSLYCIKANYTYKHSTADPSDCNQAVIEQKL